MLTIIHGDDITKSRKYFIDLKSKHPDTVALDGHDVSLSSLTQILEGGELFSDSKALFIDQFITDKKTSFDFKTIISFLSSHAASTQIVLWESKVLEKSIIASLKTATIKQFRLPQSLFTFLDSLKPGNSRKLLQLYHQSLSTTDEDAIFYMLIRHFRLLIAIHPESSPTLINSDKPIEEVRRLQSWQKDKLTKQSQYFPLSHLINHYKEMFEIESGYKTGNLNTTLRNSIDIFLLGV